MIRWVVVGAMVGLIVAGSTTWRAAAIGQPGVENEVWGAAGIVPFPPSVQAPPLRLSDLSGKPVDLAQFRGRLIMLYFWATW